MRGQRVVLRPMERQDMDFVAALNEEAAVREKVVGWDWPRSRSQQLAWFDRGPGPSTQRFIIEDEAGDALGLTGLWQVNWHDRNAIAGVKLGGPKKPRGQGFGSDALLTLMTFAFY